MSDSNKRDEGLQDYLDLLEVMAKKDAEERAKNPCPPPVIKKIEEPVAIKITETTEVTEPVEGIEVIEAIETIEATEATEILKSSSRKEKNIFKRLSNWYNNLPKKKKIVVSIIAILLAIILVLTAVVGIFVSQKLGLVGDSFDDVKYDDTIYDDGEFEDINIDIGSAGFKQALKDWATQGNENKMSSKNVINVLLVGADKGTNSGNTDVMMLVSLNKKTKQLKLVSFFRDSYLYIDSPRGAYCTKLNAAFSMGGPECLVETIENNYKIEIDNYVMVNFESFKEIVDAMGGVTVDVQKYEADYNYKKFKVTLPHGDDVTLNGEQALCFCRIRGCDSDGDVSRTRRQRQVIESIIDKVKSASIGDLNKYIDILLPYVDTGYSKTQILSLGVQALTGKWFNYERTQLQMPDEECRTSGSANAWIWVVDYQLAAYKLQNELYGQSNITLNEDRVSIIDVYRGANYKGDYANNSSSNSVPTTAMNKDQVPQTTSKADIPETTKNNKTEIVTERETEIQTEKETEIQIDVETEVQTEILTEIETETQATADDTTVVASETTENIQVPDTTATVSVVETTPTPPSTTEEITLGTEVAA